MADDMAATAMSIDTPSYARSMLGMGQSGAALGFAQGPFQTSQNLAQSMSIDGDQTNHIFSHGAAMTNPGQHLHLHLQRSSLQTQTSWHLALDPLLGLDLYDSYIIAASSFAAQHSKKLH